MAFVSQHALPCLVGMQEMTALRSSGTTARLPLGYHSTVLAMDASSTNRGHVLTHCTLCDVGFLHGNQLLALRDTLLISQRS
jgi:hypothetical protein